MFDSDDNFDAGDAAVLGGFIGMAHDLMNEEERPPEETEDIENDYDQPSSTNSKLVQRLDPELHNMVVSVLKEQRKKRLQKMEEQAMIDEEAAILAEAAEFERSMEEDGDV